MTNPYNKHSEENMKNNTNMRQQSQDLILLAHKLEDSFTPGTISVREILNALSESHLTLSVTSDDDLVAEFALQLLEVPTLQEYDASVDVML